MKDLGVMGMAFDIGVEGVEEKRVFLFELVEIFF